MLPDILRTTSNAGAVAIDLAGGTIISVSSAVAIAPEILNGFHGGTKAFVLAFSQSLYKGLPTGASASRLSFRPRRRPKFRDAAGGSVGQRSEKMVMQGDDLVDARICGL